MIVFFFVDTCAPKSHRPSQGGGRRGDFRPPTRVVPSTAKDWLVGEHPLKH